MNMDGQDEQDIEVAGEEITTLNPVFLFIDVNQ